MSTTLMPPEQSAATDRSLRILPIAANLLPVEVIAARRSREVRKIVLAALTLVVLILIVWYVFVRIQTSLAQTDLSDARASATALQQQQRQYSSVVATQAESETINTQLSALMNGDLQWSKLISGVQAAAPSGVRLTGLSGTIDLTAQAAAAKAATAGPAAGAASPPAGGTSGQPQSAPTPTKALGTITINGSGPTKESIAQYVDALGRVTGAANPLLGSAAVDPGGVQFTIQLDITPAALGGRYSTKTATSGTGGK